MPVLRKLVVMTAVASLVVACGGDGDDADDASHTRTVSDVFGTVEVPADPERVIAMEQQTLGNLMAIDFPPDRVAGFALGSYSADDFPELADHIDVESVENVGDYTTPNAEAIVAADPDLILLVAEDSNDEFYGPIIDTLSEGGRTVFGAFNGYLTIDDSMRLLSDVGVAVGREAEAADKEAEFRASIQDVADRLADTGAVPTAGFLRVYPGGIFYNTVMPILDEMGVPGTRPSPEEFAVELSEEHLDQMNHDVLFVSDGEDPEGTRELLESNPPWSTLPAVQAGRVVYVPDVLWGTSYSVLALEAQLADIENALLG